MAVDSNDALYVADCGPQPKVLKLPEGGAWTTIGSSADWFECPDDVAADSAGNVYVTDSFKHTVSKLSDGAWSTIGGDGFAGNSVEGLGRFKSPRGVAVDSNGFV